MAVFLVTTRSSYTLILGHRPDPLHGRLCAHPTSVIAHFRADEMRCNGVRVYPYQTVPRGSSFGKPTGMAN